MLLACCIFFQVRVLLPIWRTVFQKELTQAVDFYKDDLPHQRMFCVEYRMWVRKWKQCLSSQGEVPRKMVDAFRQCDETEFPNISVLLKFALTLPITTCQSERSFSQLKLTKTYLQPIMSDSRLNGLAIMKINRQQCDSIHKSPPPPQ